LCRLSDDKRLEQKLLPALGTGPQKAPLA